MKKFGLTLLFFMLFACEASAVNMVKKETYFDDALTVAGLPDFPPFSYYDDRHRLRGALLGPTIEFMKNQGITIEQAELSYQDMENTKILLTKVRSGEALLFAGAYANTVLFTGLNMLYPAAVTNPIHVIMLSDKENNIKTVSDLQNLHGVVSNSEYFNDFIRKKIEDLDVEFVDTPFEAYKKVILGEADYMLGSLYYNRIMVSRYGLGSYLSYSDLPVFKMPIFIAISKTLERRSLFEEAFQAEFKKPEYVRMVKEEIIRIINDEVRKNEGVVPPSFSERSREEERQSPDAADDDYTEFNDEPEFDENITGAQIVEKPEEEVKEKHIEDILDGI